MTSKNLVQRNFHHNWFLLPTLATTLLAISFSGCAPLKPMSDSSVTPMAAESAGSYRVEMQGGFGKKSVYSGQLTEPTTVQTAIEKSGAIKKFRNLDVSILRVVSETGQGLKMDVRFDPTEDAIVPEQDYAILPGDRIVVQPKSNNLMDKVLENVAGQ
jgi:hypothetical protein